MAFEHACFISYRHHEQSQLAERFIGDFCEALRNEITVMIEEDIFIDRERLRAGAIFDPSLSRALCKSICMIVVYTPTYFSKKHTYCAREYRAMESLEQRRLSVVNTPLGKQSGLILPIVLRGEASLPMAIKGKRHYYSFEKFSLSSEAISKNQQFETFVRDIAGVIHARKQLLAPMATDLTSICDDFSFPTEDEVVPWLDTVTSPPSPFPLRIV